MLLAMIEGEDIIKKCENIQDCIDVKTSNTKGQDFLKKLKYDTKYKLDYSTFIHYGVGFIKKYL